MRAHVCEWSGEKEPLAPSAFAAPNLTLIHGISRDRICLKAREGRTEEANALSIHKHPMAHSARPRRRKFVPGSFQFRLVSQFVGLSALAMCLQFLLVGFFLFRQVSHLDGEGGELYSELPGLLLAVFGLSLVVLLPVMFAFGVYQTFRIAGPLYRIQVFLREVRDGRAGAPCKIRESDELASCASW